MHDPLTVAFEIKFPWYTTLNLPNRTKYKFFSPFIVIWHKDPCKDHTDDSCGWFMRARHGDKEVLKKIEKEFERNWYRCYEDRELPSWFDKDGNPTMSSHAITLGMFWSAAWCHFLTFEKAQAFCKRHLYDILWLSENINDSLHQSIINRYGKEEKEKRIQDFASIVYGCLLRWERPWYKHPKWHFWHWQIQIPPLQKLKRFLFEKCSICGKGYPYGYSPMEHWSGSKHWHCECDNSKQEHKAPNGN